MYEGSCETKQSLCLGHSHVLETFCVFHKENFSQHEEVNTPKYLRLVKESPFPICMNETEMEFTDGSVSQKKLFVLG